MQKHFFVMFLFECYVYPMDKKTINLSKIPPVSQLHNAIDKFEKDICADIVTLGPVFSPSNIRKESTKITKKRQQKFNHLLICIQKIYSEKDRVKLVEQLIKSNTNCANQLVFLLNKKAEAAKNIHNIEKIKNTKTSLNLNNTILIFSIFIALVEGFYIVKIHKII